MNYIDGKLLQNDLQEFRLLIPQSGLRIKIKALIEEYTSCTVETTETQYDGSMPSIVQDDLDCWDANAVMSTPPMQQKRQTLLSSDCSGDSLACCSKDLLDKDKQHTPDDTDTPARKKLKPILTPVHTMRLPSPCPLPTNITDDIEAALKDDSKLLGVKKMRFLRQASMFYWGLCWRPTHDEYVTMAITLCDNYPKLRDKKPQQGKYWV